MEKVKHDKYQGISRQWFSQNHLQEDIDPAALSSRREENRTEMAVSWTYGIPKCGTKENKKV
jgi:hypothetical protein